MQTRWGFLNPEREGNTQRKTGRLVYWAYARVWLGYLGTYPRYRDKEVQGRGYYRVKVVCRGTQGRGHFWYGMADLCVWGERYREEQRVEVQGTEGGGHVLCVCV